MKKLGLLITLTTVIYSPMALGKQESKSGEIVQRRDASQDFAPWLKNGTLFRYSTSRPDPSFGWYVYTPRSGTPVSLSGSLDELNRLLAQEISPEAEARFVSESIASFLVDVLPASPSIIVSKAFAENFASVDPKTAASLRIYAAEPVPKFADERWALEISVLTVLGGIERWQIAGRLRPLTVTTISREVIAASGTVAPISTTR